jgi:DsbC/DsbD-like thiol-disulfide interchange protein
MPIRISLLALVVAAAGVQAQLPRPKADLTPLVATDGAHAGSQTRIALRVSLPDGLHVQSDTPRDPNLIATAIVFEPPAGITVAEVVYPKPTDLAQAGQTRPLSVFEQAFVVGARLAIDRAAPAGDIIVPARFRYQMCDAASCYPPATAVTRWTLRIVPASAPTPPLNPELFEQIRFAPARRR